MTLLTGFQRGRIVATRSVLLFGWLTAAAVLVPTMGGAADLWIDRNSLGGTCDDSRPRSAVARNAPWCTFGPSATSVQPGDVVHVRQGDYSEINRCNPCSSAAVLEVLVSGTESLPIQFVAEAGEVVGLTQVGGASHGIYLSEKNGITPRHIVFTGFKVQGFSSTCVSVRNTSDIVFRDLDISGCTFGAILTNGCSRITIENSRIHDNAMEGWTSAIDLFLCREGNIVRGNMIWANTDEHPAESEGHGIIMDTCRAAGGAVIENNVIWDNEGWCVNVFNSDGATVRNNTCWMNGLGREGRGGELSVRGARSTIQNNIFVPRAFDPAMEIHDTAELNYDTEGLDSIEAGHNIFWSPVNEQVVIWPPWNVDTVAEYQRDNLFGWGEGSIQSDPQIENAALGNFGLTRGSPAIDSGSTLYGAALDIHGFPRPLDSNGDGIANTDRGAYEFAGIFRDGFEGSFASKWSVVNP